ncbi:MAG: hypothetical protein WC435_01030 [Candidatus Paceibacterota bacterium]
MLILFSFLIGGVYLIWVQEMRLEKMGKGGDSRGNYEKAINTPREAFFVALFIFLIGLLIMFLLHYYGIKVGLYDA